MVRDHGRAEVRAIGAGAVNQAVKAKAVAGLGTEPGRAVDGATGATPVRRATTTAAIARHCLSQDGIDVICMPDFVELTIQGQERTALRITVEPRCIGSVNAGLEWSLGALARRELARILSSHVRITMLS